MEQQEQNQKRQLSEEHLRKLADGRKKGLETRRKNMEIKQALKKEKSVKLEQDYEAIVLKKGTKKQLDIDLPQEKPQHAEIQEQSDDEPEVISKTVKQKKEPEMNYKQLYYKQKLETLQASQQQQQFNQNYGQMPVQNHAIDIARHNIKSKANQLVYDSVMRSLFPSG
jgi:adenylate kinase family enzyme